MSLHRVTIWSRSAGYRAANVFRCGTSTSITAVSGSTSSNRLTTYFTGQMSQLGNRTEAALGSSLLTVARFIRSFSEN